MDEIEADILFLSGPRTVGKYEPRHDQYLLEFFSEEFDDDDDPVGSAQKRNRVSRDKIRAYNARTFQAGFPVDKIVAVVRTIEKTYSGFVHAAAVHTMDMYGGMPPRFHIDGVKSASRYDDSKEDLLNYFYRAVCAVGFAAKALGRDDIFDHLWNLSKELTKITGLGNWEK